MASLVVLVLWAAGSPGATQGPLAVPVPLPDPLGLGDGVLARLDADPSTSDDSARGMGSQAVEDSSTSFAGAFPAGPEAIPMPPLGPDDFPFGVAPTRLEVTVRLGDAMTLRLRGSEGNGSLPDEIVANEARIVTLRLEDDSDASPVTFGPFGQGEEPARRWRKDEPCDPSSCRYLAVRGSGGGAIPLVVAGEELEAVLTVLGNGVSPNRLTGRLAMGVEPGLPADVTVEVTLRAPSGTAFF